MNIRDVARADFNAVLALNEESVAFLSPLTHARLLNLCAEAALQRAVEIDTCVAAFLIGLREGASYDSPNYRWFAERYTRFLYVDRVVVSARHQGLGLGSALYADAVAHARQSDAGMLTCEFDIEPPNHGSRQFHRKFGFREVGTQLVAGGKKLVSLQALELSAANVA